ncbi:inorganic phosphate transporter [Salipiger sp. CCB-MM3]|uniref:inorganic phosphate transporter n=1 Tax=Salipiger sp. CCB-MM3 TaxID=1792508 RepID=UPI00080A9C6D|nr:inorganic phosphate transporter [Salipiger sp. CCB-MM3]ANT62778.1 inorganic phosphate transporter [Salipiger sp. CCB-MM3]
MSAHDTNKDWPTLDKDLNRMSLLESASLYTARPLVGLGVSLVFIALMALLAGLVAGATPGTMIIVVAAAFGAYMALNIGANDVANNMGPAVGSNALSMAGAIAIAAICESAGALLAGGDVVSTISKGIIDPTSLDHGGLFVQAMLAALLSAALWVNLATWIGAPVSTTHAVVGGVMGAGIAAAGFATVNWPTMGAIAASWVISPVMGGVIAAGMLAFIKWRVMYVPDRIAAARVWVPVLIGLMSGAFATYLALKGLKKVMHIDMPMALLIGLGAAILIGLISVPLVRRQSEGLENRNASLKVLFRLPLVVSAALLSFAHGANDVANAVGPLAAIVDALQTGTEGASEVSIPLWVMVIGAVGISCGLILFGPRLIRMVGSQITKLNPMRAYCVALSAAVTVIIASWLGLPVSSTHIAVGGIFGVGFFREWYMARRARKLNKANGRKPLPVEERQRRKLVRRSHFLTIAAAWVVTVPASALLSAVCFYLISAMLG